VLLRVIPQKDGRFTVVLDERKGTTGFYATVRDVETGQVAVACGDHLERWQAMRAERQTARRTAREQVRS
jgi:hypothetical protein